MKRSTANAMLAAALAALGVSVAVAQGQAQPAAAPFAQPPYRNLKVFPADIPREQLLGSMKFFSQSLGVRCVHCHVGTEGQPLSTFDFASDVKKEKRIARKMLAMTHRINGEDFGVTDFKDAKVTCFTCHRGNTKPLARPPEAQPPGAPTPPKAAATAGAERG